MEIRVERVRGAVSMTDGERRWSQEYIRASVDRWVNTPIGPWNAGFVHVSQPITVCEKM